MVTGFGLTLFSVGIVLLILGFYASQSLNAELSRIFSEGKADRSLWLLAAGALAVISGLVLAFRSRRQQN